MTNPKQEEIEKAFRAYRKTWIHQPVPLQRAIVRNHFNAGYKAAKAESPWVPIADIPEEWKGVPLFVMFDEPFFGKMTKEWEKGFYDTEDRLWRFWQSEKEILRPTHAMLPPPPPKENN